MQTVSGLSVATARADLEPQRSAQLGQRASKNRVASRIYPDQTLPYLPCSSNANREVEIGSMKMLAGGLSNLDRMIFAVMMHNLLFMLSENSVKEFKSNLR